MQADCKLFKDIQCEHHCQYHAYFKTGCHALRERRYNFVLLLCRFELYRKSFIRRCL
jgi:hypothetical protein